MAEAMVESIVVVGGVLLLMLLLIILLVLLSCKPWRFFLSRSSRTRTIRAQVDDIERPLVSEDLNFIQNQTNDFAGNYALQGACHPSVSPQLTQSGSFVLDIPGHSEDILIGQTLKRPLVTQHPVEEQKYFRKDDLSYGLKFNPDSDAIREFRPEGNAGSSLTLEVTSGLSRGLHCSVQSTNASRLPLTLGRVAPSDILLKDSEVSGKHALINWNLNTLKWEVVDMGSLNGTLLNSQAINHSDSGSRHWGHPIELADGDIITLGTGTKILVQVTQTECLIPYGVGLASDPMAVRRGGKKLPMEDVCYYRWPLPGVDQFGMFCVFDGHGGASAATSASKILPEMVATILSDSFRRERVLSQCDASDVLRDAFLQTEACMNHYYEGCTATLLLVWADGHENFFAQCANVGDSACVMNSSWTKSMEILATQDSTRITTEDTRADFLLDSLQCYSCTHMDGKLIKMTEDHRITSYSERLRMQETGEPLKDGETRLCGLNLGRMLGDKFLKQQDARFSSEPYASQVVNINQASTGFALLASDGFWDVVNLKKAFQLVQQARERYAGDRENQAEKIANFLLSEARTQRTKDNTSIIFLDFDSIKRTSSCKLDPHN